MANKGFRDSVETRIAQIRVNLTDLYYLGFPVVKELLANADDAGATRLHLGWARPPVGTSHPLLDRPGIFVVNDGRFRTIDEDGVRQLGLSPRGGDIATIGRFGLGLKSAFHLCDAFFYLASGFDGDRTTPVADIMNPWSHEVRGKHPEWDTFDASDAAILRRIFSNCCDTPDWFAIWLPLRSQRDTKPHIMLEYPGDRDDPPAQVLGPAVIRQIAKVLPLLANLRSVHLWQADNRESTTRLMGTCHLDTGSQRRRAPGQLGSLDGPSELMGFVTVASEKHISTRVFYCGVENHLSEDKVVELRGNSKWPHRPVLDPDTNDWIDRPDKATPHVAVQLIRSPAINGKPTLKLSWASYLPVGEPDSGDHVEIDGDADWEVILHGAFFVDAGRRLVDFATTPKLDDERSVRVAWNSVLRASGVLPLVIPALQHATQGTNAIDADAAARLTRAIGRTKSLGDFKTRELMCAEYQWVCVASPQGQTWKAIPTAQQILNMPINKSVAWSLEAMPALQTASQRFNLTPSNYPRLVSCDPRTVWPHEATRVLLQATADLSDISLDHLRYRIDTLCNIMGDRPQEVLRRELLEYLRQLLLGRKLTELAEQRSFVAALLRVTPADAIASIPLPCKSMRAQDILRAINEVTKSTNVLFLPEELVESARPQPLTLSCALVEASLTVLDSCDHRLKEVPYFGRVAAHLIARSDDRDHVLHRCRHLQLFRDERSEWDRIWSIAELIALHEATRLATRNENTDLKWQRAVGQAVKSDFALVHEEVGRALFPAPPPACDAAWSAQILNGHPDLSPPKERRDLLEHLLSRNNLNHAPERRAIRYLLHATRTPSAEAAVLLELAPGNEATVWDRIASSAMHASGERWRLLDATLVELLNNAHRANLSIDSVDAQGVEHLLRQIDLAIIDWVSLSRNDRVQLIVYLEDGELLARLPIHETSDGRFVRIDSNSFRDSSWVKRAPDMASRVAILREPSDQRAAARLTQLAEPFDAQAVLALGLGEANPVFHWPSIVAAAAEWLERSDSDRALRDRLTSTSWLPTEDGGAVAPLNVLRLPHDAASIGLGLLPPNGHAFRPREALLADILRDPAFLACEEHIMPPLREQITRLAGLLADVPACRIGRVDITDSDRLDEWLQAFDVGDAERAMPITTLLARFKSQEHRRLCLDVLIPAISLDIAPERLVHVLNHLGDVQRTATREIRERVRPVFLQYLHLVADLHDSMAVLRQILLPARDGSWRHTHQLCVDAHGVADGCLLRQDCIQSLENVVGGSHTENERQRGAAPLPQSAVALTDLAQLVAESSGVLDAFFAPWARVADEELIGAIIGLLGDDPGVVRVRARYLDSTRLTVFRNSLEWKTYEFSQMGGARETVDEMMGKQRFVVSVHDGETFRVTSLLGTTFDAPLSANVRTLLIGDRAPRFVSAARLDGTGVRINELRLRRVEPTALGRERCNDILRETAQALLSDLYWKKIPNFDEKWNSLAQADQIDLEFTRTWLLHQAPIYLEQLGLRTHERLGPLLRELKDADRHEHLERHEGVPETRGKGATRRDVAAAGLHRMLTEDAEIAEALLEAVRRKVGDDAQYEPESVPFELFQNADDAVTELAECHVPSRPLHNDERHWTVAVIPDGLAFVHHGRCVNQFRLGSADCSERGFNQDLEKMLVLQASDKQLAQDAAPVTGKFGLGFKSTFLVSDQPLIWSGRLRCRIHGALLPLKDDEDRPAVEAILRNQDEVNRATAIVLPLRTGTVAEAVLSRILRLFPVQMVFARSLRSCDLNNGQRRCTHSWRPVALLGCSSVLTGDLPNAPSALPAGLRAILLQAEDCGGGSTGLVMTLNRSGFEPMPAEVPSVWVTTPTKERLDLGLAINAPFAVDVGRAQLARESATNDSLAESLAASLGDSLVQLADACESDWPQIRQALALETGVEAQDLWNSLWDIITQLACQLRHASDSPGAARLLSTALWGPNRGAFARFVADRPVVPTNLPVPFAALVRAKDVRFVVHSWFTEQSTVLLAALSLPSVLAKLNLGAAVTASVWKTLESSLSAHSRPVEVSLATLVVWEIEHEHRFDPGRARHLAFLSDADVRKHLESLHSEELRESFRRAEFLSDSGEFEPAVDLLVPDLSVDEGLRAAFAPPDRVLSRDYAPDALSFFHQCRGQFQANARLLAGWAAAAQTESLRKSIIEYLLRGELRNEMCAVLSDQYPDCWLFQLDRHSAEISALAPGQAIELLAKVGVIRGWGDLPTALPAVRESAAAPSLDPKRVLRTISDWWSRERETRLADYARRTYPQHVDMNRLLGWNPNDPEQRRSWLTLFLLGAFHTIGRAQPDQHRSFLEYCDRPGWLHRFANEPTDPRTWVDFLEQYFAKQIQDSRFLQWVIQLPRIYVLSRWLPEYVEAFLSINRPGPPPEPFDILATRASTRFQGGGIYVPPLGRVLGFGYCFILRELSRHRAIVRTDIGRDCFVPTKKLREFMAALGCQIDVGLGSVRQSREICAFLGLHLDGDDCLFNNCFDIPLQIVAEDRSLQKAIVGCALADGEGAIDDDGW